MYICMCACMFFLVEFKLRFSNKSIMKWKNAEHRETRVCGIAFCEAPSILYKSEDYKWHRGGEYGIIAHCPFQHRSKRVSNETRMFWI